MLYKRQKLILALISAFGGSVNATEFQKYLFLFTTLCEKEHSYDFIPYRYGCFSFQAIADKEKLIERSYLKNCKTWTLDNFDDYTKLLDTDEAQKLKLFVERFGQLRGTALIKKIYNDYPYYAINSQIAKDHMTPDKLQLLHEQKNRKRNLLFTTIGYEGVSVEEYINKLIKNDIHALVDVRKNPISRKFGFSKTMLSTLLQKVNIKYFHIPELGIRSENRKELNTQADYDKLFLAYKNTVLEQESIALNKLIDIYKDHCRISITCFEKNHVQCHRNSLSQKIKLLLGGDMVIEHL